MYYINQKIWTLQWNNSTYRNKDFLYDVLHQPICSSDLLKENTDEKEKNPNLKNISEGFYEGFGYYLINIDSKF